MSSFRNILPNIVTLGNLFCGYLSIVNAINDNFATAAVLILLASVFDALDGKVARWTKSTSEFGAELDSICDVVSFGLAPSILMYRFVFLDPPFGMPEWLAIGIAFIPALGGALRLARFNVLNRGKTEHKSYFVGMPIPAAANILSAYVLFSALVFQHPWLQLSIPFLITTVGLLMVSTVRYESLPRFSWNQSNPERIFLVVIVASVLSLVIFREIVFFPIMVVYLLSGLIRAAIMMFRHDHPTPKEVVS